MLIKTGKITSGADGTEVYFEHHKGAQNKPTVVFIHGDNQNHTSGNDLLNFFALKDYSTLSFDRPGNGNSESYRSGSYSLERFVETADNVINQFTNSRLILIGHSGGGMIALKYSLTFPENIERLVLIEALHKSPVVFAPEMRAGIKGLYGLAEKLFVKKIPVDYSSPEIQKLNDREMLETALRTTPSDVAIAQTEAIIDFDVSSEMSHARFPILAVKGVDSHMMNEKSIEEFRKKGNNISTAVIAGGHNCIIKDKGGLVREISGWMNN